MDILSKDPSCYISELYERLEYCYGIKSSKPEVRSILDRWADEGKVGWLESTATAYDNRPQFASLTGKFSDEEQRRRVDEKSFSIDSIAELKDTIGRYMEGIIEKILKDTGCSNIGTRVRSFNLVSLPDNYRNKRDSYDVDIFGRRPDGYYLNVQSKNMKKSIGLNEIDEILERNRWVGECFGISLYPLLVCSFIEETALSMASTLHLPVVSTGWVFVPDEHWNVFEHYMDLTQVRLYRRMDEESFNRLSHDIRENILNINPAQT